MYEIETIEKYHEVKLAESIYNAWAQQYIKKNGWTVIPSEAVPPVKFDNDDRSALELWDWQHDKPEKYFVYIRETENPPDGFPYEKPVWEAITWIGQKLGNVRYGQEYRDNFGGVRQSITVYGNNGVRYYGTYYKSSGDYAQIKRIKNQ